MADENNKKPTPPASQKEQVKKIKKTLEDTKEIMEDNVDLVIERGKKIDKLKDDTGEMVKKSKKFNQDAKTFTRWIQYTQYRSMAIIIGLVLGTLYGVFSGLAWPLIIATAFGGAAAGFGLSWIASNVMRTLDIFRFFDASNESNTHRVRREAEIESPASLTYMEELASVYRPLYDGRSCFAKATQDKEVIQNKPSEEIVRTLSRELRRK